MAFSRALLLKGLAGASAVTAGGLGIGYREEIGNLFRSKGKEGGGVNGKLKTLGLEGDCLLDESADPSSFSRECALDLEKLKKIKFSNKGEGDLKVSGEVPQDLKLKIEGNKEDISFSFLNLPSSPIAIIGDKSKGKIVLKNDKKFKDVEGRLTKESDSVDETLVGFNKQLEKLNAPDECRFDETETDASAECPVTADDLKGIKFSGLEEGELKIKGNVSADLKLKAERDQGNAMSLYFTGLSGNLTIFVEQKEGEIDIRSGKKFWIGEDGKLKGVSKTVDPALKAKLGEFNGQLEKVNAPLQCRFDVEDPEESIECSITQNLLKKMEFSNRERKLDLNIVGSVDPDLKLRVDREGENAISLSFPQQTTELKILGRVDKGKIILKNDRKFKVENGKLTKGNPNEEIKKLNEQLRRLGAPIECRFDDTESEESFECIVTQEQFKGLVFSNKGTENIKIVGWPTSGSTSLKVEKESNGEITFSFPDITSGSEMRFYGDKGKINIRSDTKFTVVEEQITKRTPKEELKKFNNLLYVVNAPIECRFEEAEDEVDTSIECDVSEEQLTSMAFLGGNWWELTDDNKDLTGMRLKVQSHKIFDSVDNEEFNELTLTFKGYKKTVKLKSVDEYGEEKEEDEEKVISFVKNTNPEFEIVDISEDDNYEALYLVNEWRPRTFEKSLGLKCSVEEGEFNGVCTFDGETKKIKVAKGSDEDPVELTITNPNSNIFVLHKDQENYNQGYKFVFKGETVKGADGSPSLEEGKEYEFRWKHKEGEKVGYLVKKN